MAKILCVTSGLTGLLYSSLELCRRLDAAGHSLTYASFSESRQAVQDHGFRFVSLERNHYDTFVATDAKRSTLARLLTIGRRQQQATQALGVDSFTRIVRDVAPDLIVIDSEMHEHIIVASAMAVPTALLVPFASIWRRPGLPPPHHLVRPGVGWRGSRMGISVLWLGLRCRKWLRLLVHRVQQLGCDRVSVLRRLSGNLGFDFAGETDFGQWLIPFTYRHIPALCTHALEFEFPHVPRDGVHYLGPLVLERRVDHRVTDEVRARLGSVLERCRASGGHRHLIYAAFGSFFSTDHAFVRRLLGAVAGRDDWELVVSLGGQEPRDHLGSIPANAHAFSWVPQMDVLPHAAVAVIHGGIGTVDECVVCGVPMLVYCGFETDMGGTTARVWHHEIGVLGDRHRDGPQVIRQKIERVLTEPSFAANVQRLRACYAAYAERHVAERVIDSLVRFQPTTT